MLTRIPASDLVDFARFPQSIQNEVLSFLSLFDSVEHSACKTSAIVLQSHQARLPEGTFRRKYYTWKKKGWRGIIRGNAIPRHMIQDCHRINGVFINEWKRRVENIQRRGMKQAHQQLLRDIRDGCEIPGLPHWTKMWAEDFPGREIPAQCPMSWEPGSLSYNNLRMYAPSAFELKTMRQGRRAAAFLRPLVRTTRAGLFPGQIYVLDDMWHDHKVNFFGAGQTEALRPLEFHCIDLASTCKIAYGVRPRLIRPDGTHDQLKGREMRQLLCQLLCVVGYRPEGTQLDAEKGTASIGEELAEFLNHVSGGAITVSSGFIDKRAIMDGAFAPNGVGNFRHKAALESLGNLYHNALAHLPAQTGLSPAMQPENLASLDKYNESILKAMVKMEPERAVKFFLPVISWREFTSLLGEVYDRLNARTDHALEGWEESGYVEQVFMPGPGLEPVPMMRLLGEPQQYAGALALAHANPTLYCRQQKLSPQAVWNRGLPHLTTIPLIHAPRILGPQNGYPVKISKSHEAWVTFPETHDRVRFSPELHEFDMAASRILPAGEHYIFYPVPGTDRAVVCDTENRPLGWSAQFSFAMRTDKTSCLRQHGQMEHIRALLEEPLRQRHAPDMEELKAMKIYNKQLMAGTIKTDTEKSVEDRAMENTTEEGLDQFLQPVCVGSDHGTSDEPDLSTIFGPTTTDE